MGHRLEFLGLFHGALACLFLSSSFSDSCGFLEGVSCLTGSLLAGERVPLPALTCISSCSYLTLCRSLMITVDKLVAVRHLQGEK